MVHSNNGLPTALHSISTPSSTSKGTSNGENRIFFIASGIRNFVPEGNSHCAISNCPQLHCSLNARAATQQHHPTAEYLFRGGLDSPAISLGATLTSSLGTAQQTGSWITPAGAASPQQPTQSCQPRRAARDSDISRGGAPADIRSSSLWLHRALFRSEGAGPAGQVL